jgi:Rrf2 family protein
MSNINRQTDYAIRILLALASEIPGTRISTSRIKDDMDIPHALSQRIVADLARGNFIETFPGRDGGIQLARAADQINLLEVVEYMQGKIDVSDCLINEGVECSLENKCPVQKRWIKLSNIIRSELAKQTFDQLGNEAKDLITKHMT